jgi:muconolactone D-isomerase
VQIDLPLPADLDPDVLKEVLGRTLEVVLRYQHAGELRRLWCIVGKQSNFSDYVVDSNEALHQIPSSLPLFPFMEIKVTPLAPILRHVRNNGTTPQRSDLIIAVLQHEIDECVDAAEDLGTRLTPWDALIGWIERFTEFVGTKRNSLRLCIPVTRPTMTSPSTSWTGWNRRSNAPRAR